MPWGVSDDVFVSEEDRAAPRNEKPAHCSQHGRLSGAVRADQARDLAGLCNEIQSTKHVSEPVTGDDVLQHDPHRSVSEIGVEDTGVALHLCSRTFGDLSAAVEDDHRIAEAHHEGHVVLHDEKRET